MQQISFDSLIPQDPSPKKRRPIPGYDQYYEIDQTGEIYTLVKRRSYKAGRQKKSSVHKSGYVYVAPTDEKGHAKKHYIHRLVMLTFCPIENSDDLDVNHKDGNKQNCSLSNLEWCTHKENQMHARDTLKVNFGLRGEDSGNAKLSEDDVRHIRRLWDNGNGMQQIHIAKIFNVSSVCVSLIVRRKSWKHVE